MNNQNRKRLLVIALFMMPVIAMGLAWITFKSGWAPEGRTNRGTLINPPVELSRLDLRALNVLEENKKTWQLLTLDDGVCEAACQRAVYYTRQINVALGKNAPRLTHAYIATGELDTATQALFKTDTQLNIFQMKKDNWLNAIGAQLPANAAIDEHYIFIVDPLGNIIMYYTPDKDPHDILDDLNKTLLRYSSIG